MEGGNRALSANRRIGIRSAPETCVKFESLRFSFTRWLWRRPRQDVNKPLGVRGFELHAWFQDTETFKKMHGQSGGTQGIDNDFALRSLRMSVLGS